ncbi:hypothetical protein MSG28_008853 [Choristoneura fumiferana]|uniref:Uncharacterized protein n=1 Tax=Choristoneura fumiferana TaxID=7141 RepID=A0ACC0J876_CHOFU|nr:hypothetical protein MSG28_008853 [Choristoneura fumiferana]
MVSRIEYNTNGGKELEATFLELYKCYLLSFFEDDDLLETHWCSRPSEGLLDVLYLPYLTFFKTAKPGTEEYEVVTFDVQAEDQPEPDRDKIKSILQKTHRGRALLISEGATKGLLDSNQIKELAHLMLDSVLDIDPDTQLKWTESDLVAEALQILAIAVEGATPWKEIDKFWAITAKARLQKLYNNKGTLLDYLNEYQVLKGPNGYKILIADFDGLYPSTGADILRSSLHNVSGNIIAKGKALLSSTKNQFLKFALTELVTSNDDDSENKLWFIPTRRQVVKLCLEDLARRKIELPDLDMSENCKPVLEACKGWLSEDSRLRCSLKT